MELIEYQQLAQRTSSHQLASSKIEAAGRVGLVESFAKQRMGPIGNCLLDFDPSHMIIRDVDGREQ